MSAVVGSRPGPGADQEEWQAPAIGSCGRSPGDEAGAETAQIVFSI